MVFYLNHWGLQAGLHEGVWRGPQPPREQTNVFSAVGAAASKAQFVTRFLIWMVVVCREWCHWLSGYFWVRLMVHSMILYCRFVYCIWVCKQIVSLYVEFASTYCIVGSVQTISLIAQGKPEHGPARHPVLGNRFVTCVCAGNLATVIAGNPHTNCTLSLDRIYFSRSCVFPEGGSAPRPPPPLSRPGGLEIKGVHSIRYNKNSLCITNKSFR